VSPSPEVIERMCREQDRVAAQHWAYPDQAWQCNFQASWLMARGFPVRVTVNGVTWGETATLDEVPTALDH